MENVRMPMRRTVKAHNTMLIFFRGTCFIKRRIEVYTDITNKDK
jgi:hypothetical protein